MSKHPEPIKSAINQLVKETAGQGNVITVNRFYVNLTGSLETALLLAQIIYWSDRTRDKAGWFAKSYKEWHDEIALSEYQVRNAAKTLAAFGVETKLKKFNGSPTLHYRLKSDILSDSILKFLSIHPVETSETITETTTETIEQKITPPSGDVVSPDAAKPSNGHEPTPKKARPRNEWYDVIADTMGVEGFKNTRIANVLRARSKGEYAKYNLEVPLTDPEQVREFWRWYQKVCVGCSLGSPATVQDFVMRWQKEKAAPAPEPEFTRGMRLING